VALHIFASQRTASDAASAASFQPEKAAIIAGRRNDGSTLQWTVTRPPYVALYDPLSRRTTGFVSVPIPSIVISTMRLDEPTGWCSGRADPGGSAGQDHVAGFERAALADPRDEVRQRRRRAARVDELQHLTADAVSIASPRSRSTRR